MTMLVLGLIIVLVVGGVIGLFITALCISAKNDDDN